MRSRSFISMSWRLLRDVKLIDADLPNKDSARRTSNISRAVGKEHNQRLVAQSSVSETKHDAWSLVVVAAAMGQPIVRMDKLQKKGLTIPILTWVRRREMVHQA